MNTAEASAFPASPSCYSLPQSSFTKTISRKGLDLCPLAFQAIIGQLEKVALPSNAGLSLPLPSGANWDLLSVAPETAGLYGQWTPNSNERSDTHGR